jgi:hypothetical protein
VEVCGTRGALCGGRARGGEGECPEWPLYPSQANSRKLSRILCCPYSCFEIVKMTKIEKSHFTKKIIRTTADSVLFPSAVRGLKVSLSAFPDSFFFQSQSQRMTLPPESTRVKIVTGVHFLPETHQKL